ncbi:MAG TPA: hypothetical protein VGD69_03755 [Herpetosiphonaceae bacterium]
MLHEATPCDQPTCHPHAAQPVPGWIRHRRANAGWALAARCAASLLLAALLIASCGSPTDAPPPGHDEQRSAADSGSPTGAPPPAAPVFSATAEGDGNTVSISTSGDTAVVDVQSDSGIGAATVDLVSGPAPANIIVQLHLHGLEAFRLSFDQTVIVAEVSSGDRSISQHVELPDGTTRPIASDSSHWLDIQIASPPASLATTPQPGSFAIRMPHGLVNEQQRSFTIRWIDFYR